jgi:hypothetical protein
LIRWKREETSQRYSSRILFHHSLSQMFKERSSKDNVRNLAVNFVFSAIRGKEIFGDCQKDHSKLSWNSRK